MSSPTVPLFTMGTTAPSVPPILFRNRCSQCGWVWSSDKREAHCQRLGCVGSISSTKIRSDAIRTPKDLHMQPPMALTREKRKAAKEADANLRRAEIVDALREDSGAD